MKIQKQSLVGRQKPISKTPEKNLRHLNDRPTFRLLSRYRRIKIIIN